MGIYNTLQSQLASYVEIAASIADYGIQRLVSFADRYSKTQSPIEIAINERVMAAASPLEINVDMQPLSSRVYHNGYNPPPDRVRPYNPIGSSKYSKGTRVFDGYSRNIHTKGKKPNKRPVRIRNVNARGRHFGGVLVPLIHHAAARR